MSTATAIVERFARQTETDLRDVLRQAAQDVAENVSVGGQYSPGTPVDTGFARNNWDATLGTPPATPLANDGQTAGIGSAMALTIASADLPDTITLYNNTDYLVYLEDGSTTPKAPFVSGWIAQTRAAWPQIVRAAAARVGSAFRR